MAGHWDNLFASPTPTPSPRLKPSQLPTPPSTVKTRKRKVSFAEPQHDCSPKAQKRAPRKGVRSRSSIDLPKDVTIQEKLEDDHEHDPPFRIGALEKIRIKKYAALPSKNFFRQYYPFEFVASGDGGAHTSLMVQVSLLVGVLWNIGLKYGVTVLDLICELLGFTNARLATSMTLGAPGMGMISLDDLSIGPRLEKRLRQTRGVAEVADLVLQAELEMEAENRSKHCVVFRGLDGGREVVGGPRSLDDDTEGWTMGGSDSSDEDDGTEGWSLQVPIRSVKAQGN